MNFIENESKIMNSIKLLLIIIPILFIIINFHSGEYGGHSAGIVGIFLLVYLIIGVIIWIIIFKLLKKKENIGFIAVILIGVIWAINSFISIINAVHKVNDNIYWKFYTEEYRIFYIIGYILTLSLSLALIILTIKILTQKIQDNN